MYLPPPPDTQNVLGPIPKKIHYCWFGEKMPENIVKCIDTWKKVMPDYELVLWNESRFDVDSVQFVAEACSVKKWAFAADYIRLYAVYTEGGIYFDTDIVVLKRFDDFLEYDYFTALELNPETNSFENVKNTDFDNIQRIPAFAFQAGIFGAVKGHPYLRDCLDWYENHHFIQPDGRLREFDMQIAPDIYAAIAQKYGFRYKSGFQKLENNMVILPSHIFAHTLLMLTRDAYAIHIGVGSWYKKKEALNIIQHLKRNVFLRKIFGKKPYMSAIDCDIEYIIQNGAEKFLCKQDGIHILLQKGLIFQIYRIAYYKDKTIPEVIAEVVEFYINSNNKNDAGLYPPIFPE
ncbi:MAG: hypothetical protein LBD07_00435 [Spirochaetaceae bacterium]|jgi:hypothetical protein|nr:hypothetical protein [Spirochaetaceae bacterium]